MASKRYTNLDGQDKLNTISDLLKWRKERKAKIKDLTFKVPRMEGDYAEHAKTFGGQTTITWVGHSTFLLQIGGLVILTDPIWADKIALYDRLSAPGIPIDQLPDIDVVLISHGHYDHLHFPSIRRLKGNPLILVPEGMGAMFRRRGYKRVEELSWWQRRPVEMIEFSFVPAQHWTRRLPWDTNSSHWGGWVIHSNSSRRLPTVYFAGDSGYFSGFAEIGRRFTIDYALMPIGAYEPEWFMSAQHVTPEEAVRAFIDTGAVHFVPMHYGAFRLADDTPKEALQRLDRAWKEQLLEPSRLRILKLGETLKAANAAKERSLF